MIIDGLLWGERKEYPFTIRPIVGLRREQVLLQNETDLIKLITDTLLDPYSNKKRLKQIFEELGVEPMQIADRRTLQIVDNYEFYKNNPSQAFDNEVWFESVKLLNRIQPKCQV